MVGTLKRWVMKQIPQSVAGKLRTWRIKRSIQNYSARTVEHTYGGHRLKVLLADPLSEGWYGKDWPALPEVKLLQESSLKPGAKVFDVGAHQGVVAAMLACTVGPSGKVVAVEANPHNFKTAQKNREQNGLTQLEILHAAVSNTPGKLNFNEGLNGQIDDGTGAWGQFTVDAITVDNLAEKFGMPDVVFLDIEGAECLALAGATQVLAHGPDFFVEVHVLNGLEKLGGSVAKVLQYFPANRFELFVRAEQDESFRPIRVDDPLFADRFFMVATHRT
jgi:FkbM family methyltransferase